MKNRQSFARARLCHMPKLSKATNMDARDVASGSPRFTSSMSALSSGLVSVRIQSAANEDRMWNHIASWTWVGEPYLRPDWNDGCSISQLQVSFPAQGVIDLNRGPRQCRISCVSDSMRAAQTASLTQPLSIPVMRPFGECDGGIVEASTSGCKHHLSS